MSAKDKTEFLDDLQKIYNELQRREEELNSYYAITKGENNKEASSLIYSLLGRVGLPIDDESVMAALDRVVALKEDALMRKLESEGIEGDDKIEALEKAYNFVAEFYMNRFESIITWIIEKNLLTPFYIELIQGVHSIGMAMSRWHISWKSHILDGTNRELFELFNGDEEKIYEMLYNEELLETEDEGVSDRSYSVLIPTRGGFRKVAYAEAFREEVDEVLTYLNILIDALREMDDEVFHQKNEWVSYFFNLGKALGNSDTKRSVEYWANVDRAWMRVTTPIQVGHPLEYYEDRYRKSVALEWDMRIINPALQNSNRVSSMIKSFASKLSVDFGLKGEKLYLRSLSQIDKTQLYIGRPFLYYGAELNGLFSAQVVPNDEKVSQEAGKKIFAYADFVRESKLHKPTLQLQYDVFGKEFIDKRRDLLENFPDLWHKVYAVSTIGHEFGHILWMDEDTETVMNEKGQFKNIEEFKATTGGLMGFFEKEDSAIKEHIVDDLIARAVGLMAWKEVEEVLPYYCEGLIHLQILHESGIIGINELKVNIDYSRYDDMKSAYKKRYKELVECYVEKRDATDYLYRFVEKREKEYLPIDIVLRNFVLRYHKEFKERGHVVAK